MTFIMASYKVCGHFEIDRIEADDLLAAQAKAIQLKKEICDKCAVLASVNWVAVHQQEGANA